MTLGEYIPNSNTKLLLHLNGNSTDSSGNSNNGTDTAITYSQANGKFGQGAGFNGSSSKIIVASNASLNFGSGTRTINLWAKISSGNGGRLYNNRNNNTTWFSTSIETSGTIGFELANSYPTNYKTSGTTSTWNNNIWHLFTFIISGSNIYIYVDGKLEKSDTWTPFSTDGANTTNYLGAYTDGSTFQGFLTGSIDEVIIENYTWTPEQVKKYYTMTKGRYGIV